MVEGAGNKTGKIPSATAERPKLKQAKLQVPTEVGKHDARAKTAADGGVKSARQQTTDIRQSKNDAVPKNHRDTSMETASAHGKK